MGEENIIEVPVREIDDPPPKQEWGTKIAEYRGVYYQLFHTIGQSADGYPNIAKCIKKKDRGKLVIEILEIKPRKKTT